MSVVQIAIKALDEYSGTLTGFNQGLEIIGKGFSVLKGAAETAMSGIKKGIELAADGGNYVEMRRQFNAVAESYDQDGQAIIESIKAISQNTTSMADNVRLASKAVTTGLSGEQIEAAFTFVKRRTESTGEDFGAMSERVFQALQSGRTSVLKQMGLVVEKGDDVATIIAKMTAETKKYGDTGFNVGDSLQSMAQSQNALTTAIGAGINESELFQDAITFLESTIRDLADAFDPRYLTAFIDVMGEVGYSLLQMIPGFDSLAETITNLFDGTEISMKDAAKTAVDWLGILLSTVAETKNDIIKIILDWEIVEKVQFITQSVVNVIAGGQKLVINAIGGAVEYGTRALQQLVSLAYKTQDAISGKGLLRKVGVLGEREMSAAEKGLQGFADSVLDARTQISDGYQQTADSVNGFLSDVADGSKEFLRDNIKSFDVDGFAADMKAKIDAIDTSKHWAEALGTGKSAVDAALDDLADTTQKGLESKIKPVIESTAKAVRESMQKAIPSASDLAAPVQQTVQAIQGPMEQAVQATERQGSWVTVDKSRDYSSFGMGGYGPAGIGYIDQLKKQLRETDVVRVFRESKPSLAQQEQQRAAEEQRQEQQRLQQSSPAVQLQQMYADVNWPQEMDAFMRVIFSWLVKIANIESVPIAVSTRSL